LGRWIEEVGFYAHGILKRLVVMPMINSSLGERIVGNLFPKGDKLLRREGAHFLGWDKHVGNEGLQVVSLSWHL
jgi:hypothetical protein